MEIVFTLFAAILSLVALALLLAGPVLGIVAFVLVLKLQRQLRSLQQQLDSLTQPAPHPQAAAVPSSPEQPSESSVAAPEQTEEVPAQESPQPQAISPPATGRETSSTWEVFLGQKALGWIAVLLLLLGVAFFLRYAFENEWIGPMGQVSIGLLAGTGLVVFGRREYARGWHIFCQIVTAAGLLLLYLTSYASFGFYSVVSQEVGSVGLILIAASGAILSALYNMRILALMTVLGALAVPLLMVSPSDQYQQLFLYLGILNVGVLLVTYWRRWSSVGLVSLAGTHGIFWLWYFSQYHPEKLAWALGFQLFLFVLFLSHSLAAHVVRARPADLFDLLRLPATAFAWFAAAYILLEPDYEPWLGSFALGMGVVYLLWARLTLARRGDDARQTLVALAIAVGFITIAIPIQIDARWVALGWAAEAAVLWWFGLRVGYPLRVLAGILAVLALGRVLLVDIPFHTRDPFLPVFNIYALPALLVAACLLASVRSALARWQVLNRFEQVLVRIAGLAGVLLVWVILSVEVFGYFDAYAALAETDSNRWRWFGQMALSAFWAIYASVILAIGFGTDRAPLRWTALAFYALTIAKVLLVDMDDLAELYRIAAFIVVAIILAIAAWGYQRFTPHQPQQSQEETS